MEKLLSVQAIEPDGETNRAVLNHLMKPESTCPRCGAPLAASETCQRCELALALETPLPFAREAEAQSTSKRFGDYELLEELGHGGMGVVYKARHTKLNRLVALKLLLLGQFSSEQAVKRFQREAQAAAALRHPNIVGLHDVGEVEGQHYFTMELVEGRSLASVLRDGPLPHRQAAQYCRAIAEAMHAAHAAGIIHRDLKPSNILIDAFDQPRITDFGLAKRLDGSGDITLTGHVLGSPNYLAPELAAGREKECGPGTDIFSIGAILYECLTGRPPFMATTLQETLLRIRDTEPVAPRVLNAKLPRDLETICLKCLEKEPAKRYVSAQQLAEELDRFLKDEPILARPIGPTARLWRWCRRKPALATSFFSILILLLIVVVGSPIAAYRINQARKAEVSERLRAEANRDRADQNLYDSDMNLAQQAWDEGDLGKTLSRLQAHQHRPGDKSDRRGFEWYYFWNLCQGDQQMTLTNHSQTVNSVAFSPDGKLLATGSVGNPVQIWDIATGKIVKPLPEQHVVSLAFAPDGQTLGVGGRDQLVVWNIESGRAVFEQKEVLGEFRIAFSPAGTLLVIGKHGGNKEHNVRSAELWDYVTRERKQVFPESGGQVALSARGDRLATANVNQATTKIWDLASGQFVGSLETGEVLALALSPDGQALATSLGHWSLVVRLLDVTTGLQIGSFTTNQHKAWSLAFSPDGRSLATGGTDQMVRLWDVATRQQIEQFQGHGGQVMSVAFSTDGQTLASGSKDKTARLWSAHPKRAVPMITNVFSRPIFSPDSRVVVASIGQNKVAAWDVATHQRKATFADAFDAVAFSPDGSVLLTRGTNYFLRTFDVAAHSARETIPGRPSGETDTSAALSPDGQILATGSTNGTITFSNAKTGAVMATNAHAYDTYIFQLVFSPNGKLLATAGIQSGLEEPAAKVWDSATHNLVAAPPGHTDLVIDIAFSPDGKLLATCGVDDSIRFWDTTTWKEIPPSLGQKEAVSALAFSPNGRTLATASHDGTVKLWNVATRRELASLKTGGAGSVTFSPDGQTLAVEGGSLHLLRAPVLDTKQSPPSLEGRQTGINRN